MTKFVGIISAKGGVGKTTTTINLTSALHFFKRDVIALDANFANPDLGIHLGIPNMEKNLHTALKGNHSIKDGIYRHPSGLKVIPGSISYSEARKAQRQNLINLIYDLFGTAEAVIIDSTPGMGNDARTVIQACDKVIIVTTPDLVSVSGSLKMVNLAKELGRPVLGIIVNKLRNEQYEMSIPNIQDFLKKPVIGVIPDDHPIRQSLYTRNPSLMTDPSTPSSISFKKIAGELIGEKYVEEVIEKKQKSTFMQVLDNLGFGKYF